MIDFKAGDFVLVPYPLSDPYSTHHRPAFVVSRIQAKGTPTMAVISLVTSKVEEREMPGDYRVLDWMRAGLKFPAKIRLSKILSIDANSLQKNLGTLNHREWKTVAGEFLKFFSFWINP